MKDFDLTKEMLNYFIKKIKAKGIFTKPRILICCPSNITKIERNAIKEVAETGVDIISVGGLTHSFKSMDISLKKKKRE